MQPKNIYYYKISASYLYPKQSRWVMHSAHGISAKIVLQGLPIRGKNCFSREVGKSTNTEFLLVKFRDLWRHVNNL